MILFLLLSGFLFCYNCEIIKKENAPKLGGWRTLPLDAEKVIYLGKYIETNWNEITDSLYWFKVKVLDASVQVENKIIYQIDVIIDPTGCLQEEDFETCKTPAMEDMEVQKCHYYIKENSSDSSHIIFSKTCVNI